MKTNQWDGRIQRANELASTYSFASEALRFYERTASFQKELYFHIEAANGKKGHRGIPGPLPDEPDLVLLLPKFREFLSLVASIAPEPLALSANKLELQGVGSWQSLLTSYWGDAPEQEPVLDQTQTLLAWIFLQPYAEYLAENAAKRAPNGTPKVCPVCGDKPQVGVLRPEGDGAKRSLICALCSTEWEYRRIVCPACGEESVERLGIYTAEEFKHVRVEVCDTCHRYIKTVDLTKNGRAVPVVDELATIPLNLWASKHGYRKVQANILGV